MNKEHSDIFDRIEETVQNITSSENIENLRRNIEDTVSGVKRTVAQNNAARAQQTRRPTSYTTSDPRSYTYQQCAQNASRKTQQQNPQQVQNVRVGYPPQNAPKPSKKAVAMSIYPSAELAVPVSKAPGRVSGPLCTVFGAIGTLVFGITSLVGLANFLFPFHGGGPVFPIFPLIFFLIFGSMFLIGLNRISLARRYRKYLKQIGASATFCSLKELAEGTGKNAKFVLREIKRLIRKGFFPHGKIDNQKTCLILDEHTYQQYQDLQERIRISKEEAARRDEHLNTNPELKSAIAEGEKFIQEIKSANDDIPGELISQKLFRLEDTTSKIFRYVEAHPQKLPDIRKFMSYYLPTTLKLVNAYREFDRQPIQGENILNSKKEIEETLDTINQAFENMFDDMFLSEAVDISSDISVLETMLQQEGLTGSDFKPTK